jgi:transcriptional regulator with XRE-family HTH domain
VFLAKIASLFIAHKKGRIHLDILNRILAEMNKKNIPQKDLTSFLGIKETAFAKWKKGVNTSYLKYISQIAEFLDVSTDYLLGNEQKKTPLPQIRDKDDDVPNVQDMVDRIMALPPSARSVILAALEQFEKSQGLK